jgi:hypothetical protein
VPVSYEQQRAGDHPQVVFAETSSALEVFVGLYENLLDRGPNAAGIGVADLSRGRARDYASKTTFKLVEQQGFPSNLAA